MAVKREPQASELAESAAMWFDRDGIHIAIPLDVILQFILKPFRDAGLEPTVEVDVVKNRVKVNLGVNDVKKLMSYASANNPQLMGTLAQIMAAAQELDKQVTQGNG